MELEIHAAYRFFGTLLQCQCRSCPVKNEYENQIILGQLGLWVKNECLDWGICFSRTPKWEEANKMWEIEATFEALGLGSLGFRHDVLTCLGHSRR